MKKYSEGINSHPGSDLAGPGTVDRPRTQDDVWHAMFQAVFKHQLILFQLCKGIRLGSLHRPAFQLTSFVEQSPARDVPVRINRKRTDVYEALGSQIPWLRPASFSSSQHSS